MIHYFENSNLIYFFQIKKIKLYIFIIIVWLYNGFLYGQLDEISRIIPSHIIHLTKESDQFILIGKSSIYSQNENPEGVAVLLNNSNLEMDVFFRFFHQNGDSTKWVQGEISELPNSEKNIIYFRDEMCQSSIMFQFKVLSQVGFPELIQSGIFLPDLEKYPEGKVIRKQSTSNLPKPIIIPRSKWGARQPTHGYSSHPFFTKLTLHHAAGFSANNIEDGIEQMQAIQDLHQYVRGWSDIGYHFVVDKAGNIYQGRPETVIGAHVLSNNTGNIGVCVLGCYHPPEVYCGDRLSDATTNSLIELYAWISGEYNYNPNILLGHRDYPNNDTSCPGNTIHEDLSWFRNEIKTYMDLGGPPLDFSISMNYPNPFNNQTNLDYKVPSENYISIIIYDLMGRKVKTLMDRIQSKGDYAVEWNGLSERGETVSSGIYFLQFESGGFLKNNKLILIK